ncbi:ROK family transcriptional regulator [Marinomonas pontica]|uniref:ROK family transcriptional regulator n=1 Tax=Marinomonas pontica TaxID=264739 RepID=UPI0030C73947
MPKTIAHKPSSLAMNTDRAFIDCLRHQGVLSRAAIASQTGISKPTISESAQRLLARQVIVECHKKDTKSSKRPSVLYEINKQRGASLAIVLDDVSIQLTLSDLQGNECQSRHLTYSEGRTSAEYTKDLLTAIKGIMINTTPPLLSIGLSVADPIHPKDGSVVRMPNSPFPVAQDIHFIQQLEDAFHCSVVIDNDVNWATLFEREITQLDNFIYVFLGRGIGCGLFFERKLIRGHNGMAGEIGYVTLKNGKHLLESCYQGTTINNALLKPGNIDRQLIEEITEAIRLTCQITHPETLILGGPIAVDPANYFAIAAQLNIALPNISIQLSQAPDNASLAGAAIGAHQLALLSLGLIDEDNNIAQLGFYRLYEHNTVAKLD